MKIKVNLLILRFLTPIFLGLASVAATASELPAMPYYYVLDEPQALSPRTRHALESLVVEHDRLTGQQLMIAVVNDREGIEIQDWSKQLFAEWKIGKRNLGDGLLVTVYWKSKKAQIDVSYGLDSVVTEDKVKDILSEFIRPLLKQGQIDAALSAGVYHLLETMESPLVKSGKADEILHTDGVKILAPNSATYGASAWGVLLFLGILMMIGVVGQLLTREAHFTGTGWYRPNPFDFSDFRLKKGGMSRVNCGGSTNSW